MAKYKNLEKDIDEEFKELLSDMNEKEFTEYFKRLFKEYYEVLFSFDTDFNRYTENYNKKYDIIRKVKKLISFKYNNLDNFENLERLKLVENIAYNQMNELYFMEKSYKHHIYSNGVLQLHYINETLSNLISLYEKDSSEEIASIIEDVFKRSIDLIKPLKKLPIPEDNVPNISYDIMVIDEYNPFINFLKEQLEEFDSIMEQLEAILPEEVIEEVEYNLFSSERLEFLNMLLNFCDNEEDKEMAYKTVALIDYNEKKEEPKYLYQVLSNWNY